MKAAIKADTQLKDKVTAWDAARVSKRATHARSLATLLASLPKIDPNAIPTAVDALLDAADQYKASQPLVDSSGRRSKPSIAEARIRVTALLGHLVKVQDQLAKLPLDALAAIGQVTDAPMGKMKSDIERIRQTVEQSLADLTARPHKTADADRRVLAYAVAVVFRDILDMSPTCTSAKQLTPNRQTARGGAAYDRVLGATLHAAGVSDCDRGPLVAAGIRLLKDPNLPSRR